MRCRKLVIPPAVPALYSADKVIGLRWLYVPCNKVAEASISHYPAEHSPCLFEYFFPVGNVQQP